MKPHILLLQCKFLLNLGEELFLLTFSCLKVCDFLLEVFVAGLLKDELPIKLRELQLESIKILGMTTLCLNQLLFQQLIRLLGLSEFNFIGV